MMSQECLQQVNKWFYLCLALLGVLLIVVLVSYGYSLKLDRRQVVIEKQNQELKKEIQEVERVNGKEKRDIAELQQKFKELEKKLNHE